MSRYFFALWPDPLAREALGGHGARLARASGGRPVPAANLHLTLVFLGEVGPSRVASVHQAAEQVDARSFELRLDEIGSFRPARVAWTGFREPLPALLELQGELALGLASRGFGTEARPFAPHLTLVRRIVSPVAREPIAPVSWRVMSFALVVSDRVRGGYATVAEWPLREGVD